MMHQNKLVFAIKSNGKVLREHGDTVYIPFSSEYTLYVKNLNSVRVQLKIEIDGKDIFDGDEFIVNANSSTEIERSIVGGNLSAGNRFKFIERTAGVEKHRGAQAEDGLIRIEYEFERQPTAITNTIWGGLQGNAGTPYYPPGVRGMPFGGVMGASGSTGDWMSSELRSATLCSTQFASAQNCSASLSDTTVGANVLHSKSIPQFINQAQIKPANEAGITVSGSLSEQKFTTVAGITSDGVKHVMVLKLLGELNEVPVVKPVTVKQKPTCQTCGKLNKATAKFCSECGTALEVFA
jgi:hypothetical protein